MFKFGEGFLFSNLGGEKEWKLAGVVWTVEVSLYI